MSYQSLVRSQTATILSGASLSDAITVDGECVLGIELPSAWTSASITFLVDLGSGTLCSLHDYTGEFTVATPPTAAVSMVRLPPDLFYGVTRIQIRSGTRASAVNQGADRSLKVWTRPL